MYEVIEVAVPDIGDFADVPVIEVHVGAGDEVAAEDPLITLESDKATMDIPAPVAGTIAGVRIAVGDRVSAGHLIVDLRTGEKLKPPGSASRSGCECRPRARTRARTRERHRVRSLRKCSSSVPGRAATRRHSGLLTSARRL